MTNNRFSVFVSLILFVISVMLILYAYRFAKYGLSNNSQDWAYFGSFLGSITGLLAFAGVLYSINESKKQAAINDERNIFFKMLDLYQNKVNNVLLIKEGEKTISISDLIIDYSIIAIIYNRFIYNLEYLETDANSKNTILTGIAHSFNHTSVDIGALESQILFCNKNNLIKFPPDFSDIKKSMVYFRFAEKIIAGEKNSLNYDNYCYTIMKYVANCLNMKYGHIFSQYYRNVFNVLEFSYNSTKRDYYGNFFKSQLSSVELAFLLHYSISYDAFKKAIEYFQYYDFFKYVETSYLMLNTLNPNPYSKKPEESLSVFIKKIFHQYKLNQIN